MDDVYPHSVLAIMDHTNTNDQYVDLLPKTLTHMTVYGSETPQRQLVSYILGLEHPLVAKAWVCEN